MARRGATTRDPKVKMERLSPGVYRSAQGGLVGNKGQALPSQQPLQRQPMPKPMPRPMPASPYQPAPLPTNINAGDLANLMQPQMQQQGFQFPEMPQPSQNMGGQYRLSPGMYGTQDQAMQQYNQQMQQMGFQNANGYTPQPIMNGIVPPPKGY